jgi:CheY-like chemotaxis protein
MYLLENAIQFTNRGEIRLIAGYQKGKIRFQVVDTGIGIAANELARIFLPFHQIHQMDHRSEGAGLGLSIAAKLVTLMGGQLQVESQLDQGSLFWFALDLPDISESSDDILLPTALQTRDLRILIVDDIEERRAKICQRLKRLALSTLEAVSYSDARSKIKAQQPFAVFMVTHLIDEAINQQCLLQKIHLIAMVDDVFESGQPEIKGLPKLLIAPFYHEDFIEHLQNCFEQPLSMAIAKTTGLQEKEDFPMGPSREQAALLLEKAMRGDIYGVSCYVEQLEQAEERLIPFAKYIKELAFHLEEEKICEIAKRYMDNST